MLTLTHIVNRNKIAQLFAIGITIPPFKQFHMPYGAVLVEQVERHRSHASLVLLALAIHVEVAQADDLRLRVTPAPARRTT